MWTKKQIDEIKESLTLKQRTFAEEYIKDFHITDAAKRAGYSDKTAYSIGWNLLNKVEIGHYLSYLISARAKRTQVTADRVVQEIAKIAFHDVNELMDYINGGVLFKDLKDMQFSEIIKEITVKEQINKKGERAGKIATIKVHDKVKALELLGKHTAIFTENINLLSGGKPIETNTTVVNININHRRKGDPLSD